MISNKVATFRPIGGQDYQVEVIARISGKPVALVRSVYEKRHQMPPLEAEKMFFDEFGDFDKLALRLAASGAALPIYHCTGKRFGPLCETFAVPRIDFPVPV